MNLVVLAIAALPHSSAAGGAKVPTFFDRIPAAGWPYPTLGEERSSTWPAGGGSRPRQDGEQFPPRPDRVAVLVRHRLGDLVEVVEVVHGPGRDELADGDRSEVGVGAGEVEDVGRGDQGAQGAEGTDQQAAEEREPYAESAAPRGRGQAGH